MKIENNLLLLLVILCAGVLFISTVNTLDAMRSEPLSESAITRTHRTNEGESSSNETYSALVKHTQTGGLGSG